MKLEHKIILELCKDIDDLKTDLSKEELRGLDWPDVMWQLTYHRIETLVALKKINGMLWHSINAVVGRDLYYKYLYIKSRNIFLYETVLPEIMNIIRTVTPDFMFMKGIVSAASLYKDVGERSFNDIDVLIRKKDMEELKAAFIRNGYAMAKYGPDGNILAVATDEDIERIEKFTEQTYPISKVETSPVISRTVIDLHFGFGRHSRFKVLSDEGLIDKLMERKISLKYNGLEIPSLSKEDFLLFSCMHAYKEDFEVYRMEVSSDAKLNKYLEIYRIIKQWFEDLDWKYIKHMYTEIDVGKHVYYCLRHCSDIFDDMKPLVEAFLKEIEPDDIAYLDGYGGIDTDESGVWNMSFAERLFVSNRYSLIKDTIKKIYY